jgi:hypothetical protein
LFDIISNNIIDLKQNQHCHVQRTVIRPDILRGTVTRAFAACCGIACHQYLGVLDGPMG